MTTEEMIRTLEQQIAALQHTGEYLVIGFRVWGENKEIPSTRVEQDTWYWGSCISETCNHNSHDPYMQGCTQFVLCRKILGGRKNWYVLPDHRVFLYDNRDENGYHFAPNASLKIVNL